MIVCDTGPIVAAALVEDDHHRECVDLFTGLHLANRPLLVPATVVAEVGYLLNREAGPDVEALFLIALADGDSTPVDLTADDDYRRAQEDKRVGHGFRNVDNYEPSAYRCTAESPLSAPLRSEVSFHAKRRRAIRLTVLAGIIDQAPVRRVVSTLSPIWSEHRPYVRDGDYYRYPRE